MNNKNLVETDFADIEARTQATVIRVVTEAASSAYNPHGYKDAGASKVETIKICAALISFCNNAKGFPLSFEEWKVAIENLRIVLK